MLPGINPAMISYMLKGKLDEILKGQYPEGLVLKERDSEKIVFTLKNPEAYEGIVLNVIHSEIVYKGVKIIVRYGC